MFGFIVALVSGALMSIQGVFNTEVTKQTGTWLTNSFVQFTGFLLCLVIWFFKERKKHPPMEIFAVEPKYYLLGGVIGAFITFTVIAGMSTLVFGIFGVEKTGLDWMKLLGTGLFLAGIFIFKARG